jgi:hypothetical protein
VVSWRASFPALLEDRADLPDGGVGVVLFVDDDDGPDRTATQAGHGLETELAVRGRLAGLDVKLALELLEDLGAAPDVTGRPLADGAGMFAARRQAESAIERGDPDDVDERDGELGGDLPERLFGELVVFGLDILEDRDESVLLSLVIADEGLDSCFVDGQGQFSILEDLRGFVGGGVGPRGGPKS